MAQEEAHGIVDHRIGNQVIIINDQVQRTLPVGKLNKQLRKQRRQAGVLALLHHGFAGGAVAACRLLNRRNQIAGEALLLIIAFIKRKPAKVMFTRSPLRNERGFAVTCRAGHQRETIIVRAGKFRQQPFANHSVFKTGWTT